MNRRIVLPSCAWATGVLLSMAASCTDTSLNALESPPPIRVLDTGSLASQVGDSVNITLRASGGEGAHQWATSSGRLPPGLELEASRTSESNISGTAQEAGTYRFTINVKDAFKNIGEITMTATISPPGDRPLEIVTDTIASGEVGSIYFDSITATGGIEQGHAWDIVNGSLPDGLTLTSTGATALISGTPTRTSTSTFTIRVTDSANNTDEKTFFIVVTDLPLRVITSTIPAIGPTATSTHAAVVVLEAAGGTPDYTWSLESGRAPARAVPSA